MCLILQVLIAMRLKARGDGKAESQGSCFSVVCGIFGFIFLVGLVGVVSVLFLLSFLFLIVFQPSLLSGIVSDISTPSNDSTSEGVSSVVSVVFPLDV